MTRKRNTLNNTASKQDPFPALIAGGDAVPAPTPGTTVDLYSGLANLYNQYQVQLSQLRLQRQGLRSAAQVERADLRAQGIANMASTVGQSLERGITGSSIDLQNRIGVEAETARGLQDVRSRLLEGLASSQLSGLQAQLGYQQGVFDLESRAAAEQAAAAAQALANNTILSGEEATSDMLKAFYKRLFQMFASTAGAAPTPSTYTPTPPAARVLR